MANIDGLLDFYVDKIRDVRGCRNCMKEVLIDFLDEAIEVCDDVSCGEDSHYKINLSFESGCDDYYR